MAKLPLIVTLPDGRSFDLGYQGTADGEIDAAERAQIIAELAKLMPEEEQRTDEYLNKVKITAEWVMGPDKKIRPQIFATARQFMTPTAAKEATEGGDAAKGSDEASPEKKEWDVDQLTGEWVAPDGQRYTGDEIEFDKAGKPHVKGEPQPAPAPRGAKTAPAAAKKAKAVADDAKADKADESKDAVDYDKTKDWKTAKVVIPGRSYTYQKTKTNEQGEKVPDTDGDGHIKTGTRHIAAKTIEVPYQSNNVPGIGEEDAKNVIQYIDDHKEDFKSINEKTAKVSIEGEEKTLRELRDIAKGQGPTTEKAEDIKAAEEELGADVVKPDPLQLLADDPESKRAIREAQLKAMKLDVLISQLISMLQSGRGDVNMLIVFVLNAMGQKSNLTLGQTAAKVAKALGARQEEAEQIGKDIQEAYDNEDQSKAAGAISKLRVKLQNNSNSIESLKTILSQVLSMQTENGNRLGTFSEKIHRHNERMSMYS